MGEMLLLLVLYCPEDWQWLVVEPAAEHWGPAIVRAL
jgi:hypothetical protein